MSTLLKQLLLIGCIVISSTLLAQTQPWRLDVNAGLNLSHGHEEADYILAAQSIKPGFQAGATASYTVWKGLYIQSGLSITTKGIKHTKADTWIGGTNPPVSTTRSSLNLVYLQMPLRVGYDIAITQALSITAHAGGYLAYGIAGKHTEKTTTNRDAIPDTKNKTNSFGEHNGGYKSFDNGLSIGAGLQYKQYSLAAIYEYGLQDIGRSPANTTNTYKYYNRNLGIVIGYRF